MNRVLIASLGGCGRNVLTEFSREMDGQQDLLMMETDLSALHCSALEYRGSIYSDENDEKTLSKVFIDAILLGCQRGEKFGLGAVDPSVGELAIWDAQEEIYSVVKKYQMVIIVVGLGGGTGSGGVPVLARWLRELQIPHVVVGTLPASFEGNRRMSVAVSSLESLDLSPVITISETDVRTTMGIKQLSLIDFYRISDKECVERIRAFLKQQQVNERE